MSDRCFGPNTLIVFYVEILESNITAITDLNLSQWPSYFSCNECNSFWLHLTNVITFASSNLIIQFRII